MKTIIIFTLVTAGLALGGTLTQTTPEVQTILDSVVVPRYPVFNISLEGGDYTEVELKASTNNFAKFSARETDSDDWLPIRENGTWNGKTRYSCNIDGPGVGFDVRWDGDDRWEVFVYEDGVVVDGDDTTYPYDPPDEGWRFFSFRENSTHLHYYYNTFGHDIGGNYSNHPATDADCKLFYTENITTSESRAHVRFNVDHQVLSDVSSAAVSNVIKYVTIWPDKDSYSWMTYDNPKISWVFSRRDPVGSEDNPVSEHRIWHPIEPVWKPYRK